MHCMDVLCYENLLFFVIRGGHSYFWDGSACPFENASKEKFCLWCHLLHIIIFLTLCNKSLEKIYLKIIRILCLMLYGSFLFINFWCFTCIYILTHYDTSHHVTKICSHVLLSSLCIWCVLCTCVLFICFPMFLYISDKSH